MVPHLDRSHRDRLDLQNHEELPLDTLGDYPALANLHALWQRLSDAAPGGVAQRIDPLDIPKMLLPYMMLLDLEGERLRVRLAGTMVCEKHGGEMRGKTTDDFFQPADAAAVLQAARVVASTRRPSLARRSYVSIDGRPWSYVRLMLPLSRGGQDVDSMIKTLDPDTLNY